MHEYFSDLFIYLFLPQIIALPPPWQWAWESFSEIFKFYARWMALLKKLYFCLVIPQNSLSLGVHQDVFLKKRKQTENFLIFLLFCGCHFKIIPWMLFFILTPETTLTEISEACSTLDSAVGYFVAFCTK